MLSKEYRYKSNQYKLWYEMGHIDYLSYHKSIEELKNLEINKYNYTMEKKQINDEVYEFEMNQQKEANATIARKAREDFEAKWERQKKEEEANQLKEEKEKLKSLTPDQLLYREREAFYRNDIPKVIEEYKEESKKYRKAHNRNQWIIIVGSTIVTSTTGATFFNNSLTIKGIAAICSIMVSISAGIMGYFKYRERSINLQETADDIEHEYEAVRLGTHNYLGIPRVEAMGVFADKVRSRINQQKKQQQILEQPSDTKQMLPNSLNPQ